MNCVFITLLLAQGIAVEASASASLTVGSLAELQEAIRGLEPGATVLVADGTYETTRPIRIEGKHGTVEAPIVLRAEHRGGATIGGAAASSFTDSSTASSTTTSSA
ncbi:MAG: hypothetical protein NT105_01325 [Verrucomicrobia bacterium]|nr:hypothetical protein [Verrucomicrobiota bacterium]